MKSRIGALRTSVLLTLVLVASISAVAVAATYPLGSSPEIPAAEGTARLRATRNGNTEIKLSVKHLAPPARITSGAGVFVVWARGLAPGAAAQNLGALRVDKNLNGKLTATTPMASFDLFITCEESQTTLTPGTPELLPLNHTSR